MPPTVNNWNFIIAAYAIAWLSLGGYWLFVHRALRQAREPVRDPPLGARAVVRLRDALLGGGDGGHQLNEDPALCPAVGEQVEGAA